jgi:hypothetical protein
MSMRKIREVLRLTHELGLSAAHGLAKGTTDRHSRPRSDGRLGWLRRGREILSSSWRIPDDVAGS